MKVLVVYSTRTGNTQKVAEGIFSALPEGSVLANVRQTPLPDDFELVMPGFWIDKGRADQAMLSYLETVKGKNTAFFFTLGADPDSEHAGEVAADMEKLLSANGNTVLGHFRCQGKVDPKLLEHMKKTLPADHPHAKMTPERKARLEEAAKHPDDKDINDARSFAVKMLTRM